MAVQTDGALFRSRYNSENRRDDTMAEKQEKNWARCLSVCIVWGVVGLIVLTVLATMVGIF